MQKRANNFFPVRIEHISRRAVNKLPPRLIECRKTLPPNSAIKFQFAQLYLVLDN